MRADNNQSAVEVVRVEEVGFGEQRLILHAADDLRERSRRSEEESPLGLEKSRREDFNVRVSRRIDDDFAKARNAVKTRRDLVDFAAAQRAHAYAQDRQTPSLRGWVFCYKKNQPKGGKTNGRKTTMDERHLEITIYIRELPEKDCDALIRALQGYWRLASHSGGGYNMYDDLDLVRQDTSPTDEFVPIMGGKLRIWSCYVIEDWLRVLEDTINMVESYVGYGNYRLEYETDTPLPKLRESWSDCE